MHKDKESLSLWVKHTKLEAVLIYFKNQFIGGENCGFKNVGF